MLKRTNKRIISILVTACLILTCAPYATADEDLLDDEIHREEYSETESVSKPQEHKETERFADPEDSNPEDLDPGIIVPAADIYVTSYSQLANALVNSLYDRIIISNDFTFSGSLQVNRSVTIVGNSAKLTRTSGRHFIINSGNVALTFEGVILDGGGSGGGIDILNDNSNSLITLSGATFNNCYSQYGTTSIRGTMLTGGGALWVDSPYVDVKNCQFNGNSAMGYGGAIATNSGNNEWTNIIGCTFFNNRAFSGAYPMGRGGAIGANPVGDFTSTLNITTCEFYTNSVNNPTGATSGNVRGGAIFLGNFCTGNFTDCLFSGNSSPYDGGAIVTQQIESLPHTFNHCTFNNNTSQRGGVFFIGSNSQVSISNSTFESNTVSIDGGAAYVNTAKQDIGEPRLSISDSMMISNVAARNGGAIYIGGKYELLSCEYVGFRNNSSIQGILWDESSPYNAFSAVYAQQVKEHELYPYSMHEGSLQYTNAYNNDDINMLGIEDISISKRLFSINGDTAVDGATAKPGDYLVYNLTVSNTTSSAYTHNLIVIDEIDPHVEFYAATENPTQEGSLLIWNLSSVSANSTHTFSVIVRVKNSAVLIGQVVNRCMLTRSEEGTTTIEVEPVVTPVEGTPFVVETSKISDRKSYLENDKSTYTYVGDTVTYEIVVNNKNAIYDWQMVVLNESLPKGVLLDESKDITLEYGSQQLVPTTDYAYDEEARTLSIPLNTLYAQGSPSGPSHVTVRFSAIIGPEALSPLPLDSKSHNIRNEGTVVGDVYFAETTELVGDYIAKFDDGNRDAVFTIGVSYEGNGQTDGTPPIDSHYYRNGDTVTVADQATLEHDDKYFHGWSEDPLAQANDHSATIYAPDDSFIIGYDSVILYAVWADEPPGKLTSFAFFKVDGHAEKVLPGVQFALYYCDDLAHDEASHIDLGEPHTCWKLLSHHTSDQNGLVELTFDELKQWNYYLLEETQAIDGFLQAETTWVISLDSERGNKFEPVDASAYDFSFQGDKDIDKDGRDDYYLRNYPEPILLIEAGGYAKSLLLIIGGITILAAITLFGLKRRFG